MAAPIKLGMYVELQVPRADGGWTAARGEIVAVEDGWVSLKLTSGFVSHYNLAYVAGFVERDPDARTGLVDARKSRGGMA